MNQIRAFASGTQATHELSSHELAELVEGVIRFMKCDAVVGKATVTIEVEARPVLELDPKGLRQVLINLIKNAADALPERNGMIRIRVYVEEGQAIVDVADNGRGISKEISARIFVRLCDGLLNTCPSPGKTRCSTGTPRATRAR